MRNKPLVLFGLGVVAELAAKYFSDDSPYQVVAFTVDEKYCLKKEFNGIPVIPYEVLARHYPPAEIEVFVGVGYGENNRNRARLIDRLSSAGWRLATYVASRANVWTTDIGPNCIVSDGAVVHPEVRMGGGSMLWSNCVVGERTEIGPCCYIGPMSVVGGHVSIGACCVVGPLAHIGSHLTVGDTSFVGASSRVYSNVPAGSVLLEPGTKPLPCTTNSLPSLLSRRLYYSDAASPGKRPSRE